MPAIKQSRQELIRAIDELTLAIHEQTKRDKQKQLASDIRAWGNLSFGGMVLSQIFADEFNVTIALLGVGWFIGAYLIAYGISKWR